jgi:hypothetical protein
MSQSAVGVPSSERMIAKSATIIAEVDDCDSAMVRLQAAFTSSGGYVSESKLERTGDGRKRGSVSGRVPAESFEYTLTLVPRLFSKLVSIQTMGTDLTDEYHDTVGRLENRRALQGRYRELFKRAGNTMELLEIQRALADIDAEVDRLEGRNQLLSGRERLASLTIQFSEPSSGGSRLSLDIRSRIKSGIDGGVAGLGILLAGTMSAVIVGAPIVVVLVLVYLLTVRLVRSARRRRLHEATRQKEGQANRELGPRGESGGT